MMKIVWTIVSIKISLLFFCKSNVFLLFTLLSSVVAFAISEIGVSPDIEVKSRRMGSSVYQVPVPLDQSRKINLGIRFLITASRSRRENTMVDKLSLELVDAFNNKGVAIKKKDDLQAVIQFIKSQEDLDVPLSFKNYR